YSHGSFFHLFLLQFWFFEPGSRPVFERIRRSPFPLGIPAIFATDLYRMGSGWSFTCLLRRSLARHRNLSGHDNSWVRVFMTETKTVLKPTEAEYPRRKWRTRSLFRRCPGAASPPFHRRWPHCYPEFHPASLPRVNGRGHPPIIAQSSPSGNSRILRASL